jgi:hypothetical protein
MSSIRTVRGSQSPKIGLMRRQPRHQSLRVRSALLFLDLDQTRQIITAWVADYNTTRPHSSLGYRTPAAYADHLTATGHRAAPWPVVHTAPKCVSTAEALNRRWMKIQWQVKRE